MRGPIVITAALLLCASGTAVADEQPICADRPGKANATCTARARHFQIETGLWDWSLTKGPGERGALLMLGATVIKYGLTDRSHFELDVTPWERATSRAGGMHESASGIGDTLVRYKLQLTGNGAPVQVTFFPFVKLPTAKHDLGNGKVEAGVEFPIIVSLGKSPISLAFDPEVDTIADADGHGYHPAMTQVMDADLAVGSRMTLTGEIWGRWDFDPAGTGKQVSADGSIAYLATKDLQLDAGANFGLNKRTPDVEVYTGVSMRF